MVASVTWLRDKDCMVCETHAEGCHLQSCRLCGITWGILVASKTDVVSLRSETCPWQCFGLKCTASDICGQLLNYCINSENSGWPFVFSQCYFVTEMPKSPGELQLFKGKSCRKIKVVQKVVCAVIGPLYRFLIFLLAYTVLELHTFNPRSCLPSFWSSSKK